MTGHRSPNHAVRRRVAIAVLSAAAAAAFAGCTADEAQQPAQDPAGEVLFTGDKNNAVPTTAEATTETTEPTAPVTYEFGSTTTAPPTTGG